MWPAHLAEVLRREPGNQEAHFLLGRVLQKQGTLEEARRQFEEALRLDPRDGHARAALDEIARKQPRTVTP
jgi:Flp pilus assembly protein TadD